MKISFAILTLAAALALPMSSRAQLLLNGNFETLKNSAGNTITLTAGDNTGIIPYGWIIGATATATTSTASLANLADGTATGTQAPVHIGNTTLASYADGSSTHTVSFDGDGATAYVIQNFTLASASPLNVVAAFGGRDYTSATAGNESNWTISSQAAPGTILATGTATLAPFGGWTTDSGTTATLPAGNYRINITLSNPDEVDGVVITPTVVPEPSAWLMIGGGLCVLGLRFRRTRRR